MSNTDIVTMPASGSPAAIVGYFHGGSFVGGNPERFSKSAEALAGVGIGSVSFSYRVHSRNRTTARDAVDDAIGAARRFKKTYSGVPLFFSGASAGGLLAVRAALQADVTGVMLINPVLDLSETGFWSRAIPRGGDVSLSPLHMPLDDFPPTLILHGTKDRVIPIETSEKFCAILSGRGIASELVPLEGVGHNIFGRVPHDKLMAPMAEFIFAHIARRPAAVRARRVA